MEPFEFDLLVERLKPISKVQNIGTFTVYQDRIKPVFDCTCVELGWHDNKNKISCIPTGTYPFEKRYTEKRGWHIHIKDVPGRTWILIHDKVNYVGSKNPKTGHSDVLGCLIPCYKLVDLNKDGILDIAPKSSTEALNDMLKLLPKSGIIKIV